MTFQLQIDKRSFEFRITCIGIDPLRQDPSTRTRESIESIRHVYLDLAKEDRKPSRPFGARARSRNPISA